MEIEWWFSPSERGLLACSLEGLDDLLTWQSHSHYR